LTIIIITERHLHRFYHYYLLSQSTTHTQTHTFLFLKPKTNPNINKNGSLHFPVCHLHHLYHPPILGPYVSLISRRLIPVPHGQCLLT